MLSNGRDSAEQAKIREMVARGYAKKDPDFMVA